MYNLTLVSVIVPTYKRTEMLSRALDSLLSQTYSNIEVVLVNDNGENKSYNDSLDKIVEKYISLFTKFKYIENKKNKGASEARNIGVEKASGSLVTFLDDDDIYHPEKVSKQVNLFNNSTVPNLGAVYCQIRTVDEYTNKILDQTSNFYKGNRDVLLGSLHGTLAGTPALMLDRQLFLTVGGFRELLTGEDWCLLIDILLSGKSVDFNKETLLEVRIHSEERISTGNQKYTSKLSELLTIKEKVIRELGLEKSQTNQIYFSHYYTVASMFKYSNRLLALKYIFKATSYSLQPKKTIVFLGSGLLGEKLSIFTKDIFYKTQFNKD